MYMGENKVEKVHGFELLMIINILVPKIIFYDSNYYLPLILSIPLLFFINTLCYHEYPYTKCIRIQFIQLLSIFK